jgi:hypothetical protein
MARLIPWFHFRAMERFRPEAWQSLQGWEHGMKTLLPLRQWLNVNVDLSKAVSMKNPMNAHRLPELRAEYLRRVRKGGSE